MALKQLRAVRATGAALGIAKPTTACTLEYTASTFDRQEGFDPAAWITRRVPVSMIVARHIAELNGLGEARS